ncbi:Signal transduction histidine kinase [Reichenbachiella faecimaris]|uniref:histidine kinase n=1 Tax=Reichenbachiella faecimaris TaxID=692418 RepID=A0A1W2GR40_REIFA|nr:ATP-binding protein [Reichenbachiella faecimaris]SMD39109.1 Signal transduction histidine kinase [Reichenbachiella faecimaris]
MRNDFQNLVLDELLHIANGESRVTEQIIEKEKDDKYKEVLVALLELSEDIKYKKKESELIIEELNKEKQKAEMATKAKAEFLSMISHEIRTPLNAIIGIGHILMHESPRTDQLTYIQNLRWSGDNLLAIINNVLDFNKIEAGKVNFESTPFNVISTISGVLESMRMKANEQNCKLIKSIDENLPEFLVGDPTRFIQILNNLVSNAVKFTMNGTVRVDAQFQTIDEKVIALEISVSDSGIGISEDKIKQIFEQFNQADSKINRKFGGTGLGLTITKQLIELQGGKINVESEPSVGSNFKITIPFELPNEMVIKESHRGNTNYLDLSLKGSKILIVEDIAVNRLVVEKFLTEWEVITAYAENGMEAINSIISEQFDLVLMDLQMPVMDGFIATSEIRKLPRNKYRNLPIVALTAASISEVSSEVFDSGMNDIVSKPINPAELYKTISKYVKPSTKKNSNIKEMKDVRGSRISDHSLDLKFDYMRNLAKGDMQFLKKVLSMSVKAFQNFITEYSSSLMNDDLNELSNIRHKIYASINNFEIIRLMDLMQESKKLFVSHNKKQLSNEVKFEHMRQVEQTTIEIIEEIEAEILNIDLIAV